MRKLIAVFMMSTALVLVAGCKTSQTRHVASAESADPYVIADYNYKLTDIATANVSKEQLFSEIDPQGIILNTASVCSNRALMWGWNMKRKHNIDSGKVFVFYSRGFFLDPEFHEATGRKPPEPGETEERQWWYHVAPYVVENGKEYVLDHGFSPKASDPRKVTPKDTITTAWNGPITRPLSIDEWMLRFPKTTQCKELTAADVNYTDHMRRGAALPHPKDGGTARCYYRKIPMQYWTPLSVAMHEIKKTAKGEPLIYPFDRDQHWESDILLSCEEALAEDGLAKHFGKGKRMEACLSYLGLDQSLPGYASLVPLQPYDKKLQKRKERALRSLGR